MSVKKTVLYILALTLVISSMSIMTGIAAESKIDMFGAEAAKDGSRFKNTGEGTVAVQLNVTGGKFVGLVVPSWYSAPSSTIITLHKWDTDYTKTINSAPIFADLIVDDENTGWIDPGQHDFTVKFERAFAEGKYLLVYRKSEGEPLHIPTRSVNNNSVAYFNGTVYENVSYQVSCLIDAQAALNETPNIKVNPSNIVYPAYGTGASSDGESFLPAINYDTIGHYFKVTEGRLTGFVINSLFLDYETANIEIKVYKWKTDYTTTLKETPVFDKTFEATFNGVYKDFKMEFERAYAEGEYLVIIYSEDGLKLWSHAQKDGVVTYLNDEPYEGGTIKVSYIANKDIELDERPVVASTPEPTKEPTSTPEKTATSVPTATPNATDDKDTGDKSTLGNNIIVIVVVVVVIAVAVVLIIILKGKRNK